MRIVYTSFVRWLTVPQSAPEMNPVNFRNVQIDAVGVGLASTASPFLQVFIRLMGASTLQVSMLTTMPAVTGLLLALPLGRFLQTRKNIVPWLSAARLAVLSCYALTGLIAFILPEKLTILGVLGIWALATVPQTVLSIAFSVVMNSVPVQQGATS
jgi:tellurite resistance protein TehA-like permease